MALGRALRNVKSVLFVCTGNICRSPIAEGLFRRLLGNRKDIEVVSAGVHAVRGQPPSLYAVQVCEDEGVDISGQRSQPISSSLVDRATHIFAMTGGHVETIQTQFPQSADKTFLFREFEEPGTTVWRDVPDPIGLGREVYEDCAHIIKNALPSVLAFVEQGELVRPGATHSRELSSYSMDDLPQRIETGSFSSTPPPHYGEALRRVDPEIFEAIVAEEKRQRENIELIASENFTSRAVMEAQGSVLTNKYAEGYPRRRWYGGCENVDTAEQRFSAAAPNRGFGGRAFVYRHGAHRRACCRWSAPEPDSTRAVCHDHHAQKSARTAWRYCHVRREIRQADRCDCFPGRARRTADARHCSESGLLS